MKTAFIHQPHFLPWSGYIARVLLSDIFVIQDDVKYNKQYYQNRVKIRKGLSTKTVWLSMPISGSQNNIMIDQARLGGGSQGLEKLLYRFNDYYSKTRYFNNVWPEIETALHECYPVLVDINIATLKILCENLSPYALKSPQFVKTSELDSNCADLDEICKAVDADSVVFGQDSTRMYGQEMCSAGIKVLGYELKDTGIELSSNQILGLTILYDIFKIGYKETAHRLSKSWTLV